MTFNHYYMVRFLSRRALLVQALMLFGACSNNDFSGQNGTIAKKLGPLSPGSEPSVPVDPGTDDSVISDDEGVISTPDYGACKKLPTGGYASVGKCGTNEVMVMINDGNAGGRSCCPIGPGALSVTPSEVNQPRSGSCQSNEVSTGIQDMRTPYCTKINTAFLRLSSPVSAIYGTRGSAAELAALAAGYHNNDLCACPAGTIIIGGIPSPNNSCSTIRCASIEKK